MITKQRILKELDRLLTENEERVSLRTIAGNLKIAPATITYQFNGNETLYLEYLKYKLRPYITPKAISSFEEFVVQLGHGVYDTLEISGKIITSSILDDFINTVIVENLSIIDGLYENTYGEVDRKKIVAILSESYVAMAHPKNISLILDIDLSKKENRDSYIREIIYRETKVRCVAENNDTLLESKN